MKALLLILLAGCASGPGGVPAVDLLAKIDVKRDGVNGTWTREGPHVVTAVAQFARLQFPHAVPEEYDLEAVVERVRGTNSLILGLAAGGKQVVAVLDGTDAHASGLDQIGGKQFYDNPTTFKGALFMEGKSHAIRAEVRRDSVRLSVDGRKIIDWKADFKQAGVYPQWRVPDRRALFIGSWETAFRVRSLMLSPVGSERKEP